MRSLGVPPVEGGGTVADISDDILYFNSDYMEGAHPAIMEQLARTNLEQTPGYGYDEHSEHARELIRRACETPEADVWFLVGGTQTNVTCVDALLASYQGVIAAESGHVSVHEAGAVEFHGHKVLELPADDGKIGAEQVDAFCSDREHDGNNEHMVMPGMVYLSQPTEYGTLYTLRELEDLREVCDKHGLRLYVDGARLAYALAAPENDVSLPDLGRLCDMFYIGGTKCGCLFGEAVVIPQKNLVPHFFTIVKQHGALLAKGRITGIQFETLFERVEDGKTLYEHVGKPAIRAASRIRECFRSRGMPLFLDSPTNQTFVTVPDADLPWLSKHFGYDFELKPDATHTVIRFCTSWATTDEQVDALVATFDEQN